MSVQTDLLGWNLEFFYWTEHAHQPGVPKNHQREVKYVKYMQVMKMYARSESIRLLIKSRLRIRRGSGLACIWYIGTLTNETPTWNQLSFSLVWLSSLWGSLCCNKFLIAKAPVFFYLSFYLYIAMLMLICRKCSWLMSDFNQGWKSWDALPNLGDHWKCYLNFNNGGKKKQTSQLYRPSLPPSEFSGRCKGQLSLPFKAKSMKTFPFWNQSLKRRWNDI